MAEEKKPSAIVANETAESLSASVFHHYAKSGTIPGVIDLALRTVQDMTPEAASALKEISDNTYAVPAREETKRATLTTVRHFGTLGVVAFSIFEVASKLTDPRLAAGLLALALVIYAVLKAKKALDD